MKIIKIEEVVNINGELIGSEETPQVSGNLDSEAKNTTDYNIQIGHQPYRYDTLARFGFLGMPFYEGVEDKSKLVNFINENYNTITEYYKYVLGDFYKNPDKSKAEYRKYKDKKFDDLSDKRKEDIYHTVIKLYESFDGFVSSKEKDDINEQEQVNPVVEDLVKAVKLGITNEKKDVDILDKDIKKVADLINKLDNDEKKKLVKLIEVS